MGFIVLCASGPKASRRHVRRPLCLPLVTQSAPSCLSGALEVARITPTKSAGSGTGAAPPGLSEARGRNDTEFRPSGRPRGSGAHQGTTILWWHTGKLWNWWALQDSNLQPRDYESPALTIELRARLTFVPVGQRQFKEKLAATCASGYRSRPSSDNVPARRGRESPPDEKVWSSRLSLPGNCAAFRSARDDAACAAPSLRSGVCVRA